MRGAGRLELLWLVWVVGFIGPASGGAAASSRTAQAVYTDTPPTIDGVMDEPAWHHAAPLEEMVQVVPVEGAEPSEPTEIRILYDRDNLYLGIRMYDSEPDKLIATQMVLDESMTGDDRINLVLDTFYDHRNAYFFQINPAGTRSDALIENNSKFRRDWDGIWYAEATVDDKGWTAEFAIPFRTVAFAADKSMWGLELERMIRRRNETVRWANPSRNRKIDDVAGIGTLTGLFQMKGTGVDVKPSGSLSYAKARDDDRTSGFAFDPDRVAKPSLDVFYKFHPSVTAGLTLNTDFLEAPVDDFRTDLTRFPPFFPERRDFFLQDAGIFEFGGLTENGLPYLSRRVGRLGISPRNEILEIDYGLKLTGRVGNTSFGGLHVRIPEQPTMDLPEPFTMKKTSYLSVVRVQHNVLGESAVGLIGTQGDPLGRFRTGLVGADFQYFNSHVHGSNILSGTAFFMRDFREDGGSTPEAFGAKLEYPNDRYNGDIGFMQIGDDFCAQSFPFQLCFANRWGIRQYDARAHYRLRPKRVVRSLTTAVDGQLVTDLDNELETLIVTVDALELESHAGDKLKFTYIYNDERLLPQSPEFDVDPGLVISEGSYRFDRYGVRLDSSNGRPVRIIAEAIFGTYYSGKLRQLNGTLELRPSRYLFVSLEYEQNDGWLDEGDFTQRLARVRLNLALTPEISWTNTLQYGDVANGVALDDRIALNSIFRWEIESGNDLYLVFNQNWDRQNSDYRSLQTLAAVKLIWTFRF